MRGIRFDRLLAGSALAVVLAAVPVVVHAEPDAAAIEALVPVPEPADLPPPTIADIGPPAAPAGSVPAVTAAPTETPVVAPPSSVAAPATTEPAATTPPAAAAVKPAAAESPSMTASVTPPAPTFDEQVAEKLRAALTKPARRDKGIESFYAARAFAPVFTTDGTKSARTNAAAAYLAKVDADGLDPSDYALPEVKAGADAETAAEAELKIASTLLTYVRHASNGRVHYSRVSADVHYPPREIDNAAVLAKLADAKDVAAALDGFNPQQPAYKALKAKLAEVRNQAEEAEPVRIPSGQTLRLVKDRKGQDSYMQDPRVPLLRQRLGLSHDPAKITYDDELAEAVRKFQREHGLQPDGLLGNRTVDVLNGGKKRDRVPDVILANMERWRWLPNDLGKSYVMLNIPDFSLKVMQNGKQVWTTRVVVGKPSTPTPILTETMKYITVNPTWNVPPSIIYNEYLPALQQDPTVLDRMGLKLTQNRDGSVHISQPPGEANALGRIRFNFPNKFLVYQHDTPDKHLFAKDVRAYSHGCMRVQDPAKYAEVLLGIALPSEGYSAESIKKMYGSSERDIRFPTPIPVHITYQTAFVDDAGKLQIRDDIYGRDTRVLAALKGDDRRVADVPIERPQQSYARPPARLPERFASGYNGGGNFFERLFGGGPPEPPAPVRNRRSYYSR